MAELQTLAEGIYAQFGAFFLVFCRVGAVVSLMPGFGEASVSVRVKIAVALAMTTLAYPMVSGAINVSTDSLGAADIGGEILVGVFFGLCFRLLILALQIAGTIAAQATSLSQILGGASVEPLPAMGHILVVAGLCLLFTLGFHVKLLSFVMVLYQIVPVGLSWSGADVAEYGMMQVARAFGLAFTLAAPFVVFSLIYNVALGAINRAMPQLMVAFVGAPFVTFSGLFILFLSAAVILSVWSGTFFGLLADPLGVPNGR